MKALLNERKCGYCKQIKHMTDYQHKLDYVCKDCARQYRIDRMRAMNYKRRKSHGSDWLGKRDRIANNGT